MQLSVTGYQRLLGTAVLLALALWITGSGWLLEAATPGEAVPDSIASTLRGGVDCGQEITLQCLDSTDIKAECKVINVLTYMPPGQFQPDADAYCGAKLDGVRGCGKLPTTSKKCGG